MWGGFLMKMSQGEGQARAQVGLELIGGRWLAPYYCNQGCRFSLLDLLDPPAWTVQVSLLPPISAPPGLSPQSSQ